MPFVYVISVLILVAIFAWLVNFYGPVSERLGRTPTARTVNGRANDPLRNPAEPFPTSMPIEDTPLYDPDAARATQQAARDLDIRDTNLRKFANLVLLLVVIGIFLWLINTYVPMAESIKAILNIVVVVASCVMVLKAAGLWDEIVRTWNNLVHRRIAH